MVNLFNVNCWANIVIFGSGVTVLSVLWLKRTRDCGHFCPQARAAEQGGLFNNDSWTV